MWSEWEKIDYSDIGNERSPLERGRMFLVKQEEHSVYKFLVLDNTGSVACVSLET